MLKFRCRLRLHKWVTIRRRDGEYGITYDEKCSICPAQRVSVSLWRDS